MLQKKMDDQLGFDAFDIKRRSLLLWGKAGVFTYISGYIDTQSLQRILSFLMAIPEERGQKITSMQQLSDALIPFGSTEVTKDAALGVEEILRGNGTLTLEGVDGILILDLRDFPTRPVEEPEKDRTLRGPHVGTNESLTSNLVQIRRYLRDRNLRTEKFQLGTKIPSEIALLSVKGRADEAFLGRVRKKLQNTKIPVLSMNQETLATVLVPRKGLAVINPFPKVRFTERPDVIAASLMEGKIAILCDTSPSVILLPQSLFDFFEETDDYYFPPITASYLRIVRVLVFILSALLIPLWLLAVRYGDSLPGALAFLLPDRIYAVPLFLQFLIIEFAIDGLKMASLNTPTTLSGSFSVIGGLLLGEFAVESGWFVPQAILYSAFTGVTNFIPTNIELGYCFKLMRITLILLVQLFGPWGLVGGVLAWILILCSTRGAAGKSYLYPIRPFDKNAMEKIFIRKVSGREKES